MPASLVPNGKQQFIDINGAPLVGGFVYMYEPLTLIDKDTWQDSGQNTLNTQPITLDSRGQCVIYGTGGYRQIVKDSLGNTIWDEEIADYQASVFGPQDSIASNTITDLGSVASNNILITGTTTINSFGTSASLANPIYFIQFSGVLQLTYNATSMILPGAANITTAANDSAMVEVINASLGYWRMIAYFSAAFSGALGTAAYKNTGTSGGNVPLLNGNNVWQNIQGFQYQTYGVENNLSVIAAGVTPDFSQANNWNLTVAANFTMLNPVNAQAGQSGVIRIVQTAASISVTWAAAYKASGGIGTVGLSGIINAVDYWAYYIHSSTEVVITPIYNIS